MPLVKTYELHGSAEERPALFLSITCPLVKTKAKRSFVERDHELLSQTFQDVLGLDPDKDIRRINGEDCEEDALLDNVKRVAESKDLLNQYKMLIVHISSYGKQGHIYSYDCEKIPINDIIEEFRGANCFPMVGKPKWFIVQACTEGLYEKRDSSTECDSGLLSMEKITYVPSEADILTTVSEIPGNVHWRKTEATNSPFIEALCANIQENIKLDINGIFSRTIQTVYEELQSEAKKEFEDSGSLPYMTSTLTRALRFHTVNAALNK